MLAAKLASLKHGSNQFEHKTNDAKVENPIESSTLRAEASQQMGVTKNEISKAHVIEEFAPLEVEKVQNGKPLDAAYKVANKTRKKRSPKKSLRNPQRPHPSRAALVQLKRWNADQARHRNDR